MGIFGKTGTSSTSSRTSSTTGGGGGDHNRQLVQRWSRQIRREMNGLDRQINQIRREEAKVVRSIKGAAKKNDMDSAKVLGRELVRSRKAVNRLFTAKAQMNSVDMAIKTQSAQSRIVGEFKITTEAMKAVQSLVKMPEVNAAMNDMSREMMKAGVIDEMLDDVFETVAESAGDIDDVELEAEVQHEIDKIVSGIAIDTNVAAAAAATLKAKSTIERPEVEIAESGNDIKDGDEEEEVGKESVAENGDDDDLTEIQERLQALRS